MKNSPWKPNPLSPSLRLVIGSSPTNCSGVAGHVTCKGPIRVSISLWPPNPSFFPFTCNPSLLISPPNPTVYCSDRKRRRVKRKRRETRHQQKRRPQRNRPLRKKRKKRRKRRRRKKRKRRRKRSNPQLPGLYLSFYRLRCE